MANLHFFYGTMGAAKSTKLIQDRYNFIQNGTRVYVIKPQTDRHPEPKITTRIGLECPAAIHERLNVVKLREIPEFAAATVVLVDEVQFFTAPDIDALVTLADAYKQRVFCYGLMVDVNEKLFPASKHLIEVGAKLHELPVSCQMPGCQKLANHHLRYTLDGIVIRNGDAVCVDDGCVKYISVCRTCYDKALGLHR
jgi:thymidine kinase